MILGFKPQFPEPIKKGIKKHTIREDKHNRWKAGHIIHMATGVRTKLYNCFYKCKCTGTQKIEISVDNDKLMGQIICVYIDSKLLYHSDVETLAKNDGFDSAKDFFAWFNKDFSGKIIHWTDLRY